MSSGTRLLFLAVLSCISFAVQAESGLLVTFPKTLTLNTNGTVCFTTLGLNGPANVLLSVTYPNDQICRGESTIWQTTEGDRDACLHVEISCRDYFKTKLSEKPSRASLGLSLMGLDSDGQAVSRGYDKTVVVRRQRKETFIQTDKPIYQPGQKVMFRILTVTYPDMTPEVGKGSDVWITSPGGTRIQQWRNQANADGLLDLDFALSTEPDLGEWRIHYQERGGNRITQSFSVEEYVLPKFEVTITPPTYLFMKHEIINVKICARYTYGQPVQGTVHANITVKPLQTFNRRYTRQVIPVVMDADDATGCADLTVPAANLSLDSTRLSSYHDEFLVIKANFTERGTDVSMHAESSTCPLVYEPVQLKIRGPSVYKPGLRYRGEVVVTKPDGSPAETHYVKVSIDGESAYQTVQTGANGVGVFKTDMPFQPTVTSLRIKAEFDARSTAQYAEYTVRAPSTKSVRFYPKTFKVTSWYSPSTSFLDLAPFEGRLTPGAPLPVQLAFTLPRGGNISDIDFFYRVVSRGQILSSGQQKWTKPRDAFQVNVTIVFPGVALEQVQHLQHLQRVASYRPTSQRFSRHRLIRGPRSSSYRPYNPYDITEPDLDPYQPVFTGDLRFDINTTTSMSPTSHLLVYYIRSDGEVVSASADFKMETTFKNQVSVAFLEGREVRPGRPASVAVTAAPGSLCALGVVDKSVHIMGGNNQLTKDKVFDPLSDLSTVTGSTSTECPYDPTGANQEASSRHADAMESFRTSGLDFLSDLSIETRPCWIKTYTPRTCGPAWLCFERVIDLTGDVGKYFYQAQEIGKEKNIKIKDEIAEPVVELHNYFPETWLWKELGSWWCLENVMMHRDFGPQLRGGGVDLQLDGMPGRPMAMPQFSAIEPQPQNLDIIEDVAEPVLELRNYFPETWLWKLSRTGSDGVHVTREDIPHTITDWVASAFCLSSDRGVGVADSASIRAFQPFFLSYTIPYSVVRGEKVPVKVTVFNYLTSCLNIQLTMTENANFSIESRPESETVEVCGNKAETLEYEIIPMELGDIPIRVSASASAQGNILPDDVVFPVTDAIEDTILVEPEGAERMETFSELICPADNATGVYEASISLNLPTLFVPGSARGRIQVIGDVMGPVMSNLDSLLRMPFGCGEQNMIVMAPNIYVLQYLTLTNQLTSEIEVKAMTFMQSGYQRELTFGLSDGSYSAFGERDGVGSTWLTAFVLKCFAQAQEFMNIDTRNLLKTSRWLTRNPRDTNGCVIKQGRVIHKEMQGDVNNPVTLTAFVTISLLEGGISPQDADVVSGLECLKNWLETSGMNNTDTYSLAMASYAFGLGEYYTSQEETISILEERAVGDENVYHWSTSDATTTDDTLFFCFTRAPSADVEATAYALLSYMQQDQDFGAILEKVMPIVKWLNSQRNSLGGFSSTQDTVLGLQALSAFAELVYSPEANLSISIDVSASRAPPVADDEFNFDVTPYNRLVLQRSDLAEVPTELAVTAMGEGCALFQAELRYNVPVVLPSRELFQISVQVSDWMGNSVTDPATCGDKTIQVCVRYTGMLYTGSSLETNMAVMEVKMVSGYLPHEDSLEEFFSNQHSRLGLKRIDKYEKGKPLALYFDKFDPRRRCVSINLKQQFVVKETKDAVIKVYDYYKPGVVGFKSYNTC